MSKYIFLFFTVFLIAPSCSYGQDHAQVDKAIDRFRKFYNEKQTDSLYSIMAPRVKQLLPKDKIVDMVDKLHMQMGDLTGYEFSKQDKDIIYYHASFSNMRLMLLASIDSVGLLSVFRFAPDQPDEPATVQDGGTDFNATNGNLVLYGTLTMPSVIGKVPVVLLIAGSGPTDRNGNNNMGLVTNAYSMLADSLKKAGIACVRYDKRSIGKSVVGDMSEADMRFDNMVDDALEFIKALNSDSRFSGVYVVGHSEGSLVGMIAAQKGNVKKYVSLAGAGERADKVLRAQLSTMPPLVRKNADEIMDSLLKGYDARNVNEQLGMLFRPSIQPYMRSWLKYDPAKEIKKVKVPVLIIQGGRDIQVSVKEAHLLKDALPAAQYKEFPEMNHVLKNVGPDAASNNGSYHNGSLELTPGLASFIVSFIKKS